MPSGLARVCMPSTQEAEMVGTRVDERLLGGDGCGVPPRAGARCRLYEVNLEAQATNPGAVEGFLKGLWAWQALEAKHTLEEVGCLLWARDGKADMVDGS